MYTIILEALDILRMEIIPKDTIFQMLSVHYIQKMIKWPNIIKNDPVFVDEELNNYKVKNNFPKFLFGKIPKLPKKFSIKIVFRKKIGIIFSFNLTFRNNSEFCFLNYFFPKIDLSIIIKIFSFENSLKKKRFIQIFQTHLIFLNSYHKIWKKISELRVNTGPFSPNWLNVLSILVRFEEALSKINKNIMIYSGA